MLNIVLALTNLPLVFLIYKEKNSIKSAALLGCLIFSTLYHLTETRKYNVISKYFRQKIPMTGIGYWKKFEYTFLVLDRFFALSVIGLYFDINILYKNYGLVFSVCFFSFFSEVIATLSFTYVVSHSLWHFSCFALVYYFI